MSIDRAWEEWLGMSLMERIRKTDEVCESTGDLSAFYEWILERRNRHHYATTSWYNLGKVETFIGEYLEDKMQWYIEVRAKELEEQGEPEYESEESL